MTRFPFVALAVVALVACERPKTDQEMREDAAKALRGTLTYPGAAIVSVSAGDEAAQLVMSSPDSVTVIARWFARALTLNKWEVKRTVSDRSGAVTIYAEQNRRPLWLTLRPNVGGSGTTYTMIGVIPKDSVKS